MKTIEQYRAAVDEIKEVCKKHGVLMTWHEVEGIILNNVEDLKKAGWTESTHCLDCNKVMESEHYYHYYVNGIGELQDEVPELPKWEKHDLLYDGPGDCSECDNCARSLPCPNE